MNRHTYLHLVTLWCGYFTASSISASVAQILIVITVYNWNIKQYYTV